MPKRQLEDTITITVSHYSYLSERSQRLAGLLGRAGVWTTWYSQGRKTAKETADGLIAIIDDYKDAAGQAGEWTNWYLENKS